MGENVKVDSLQQGLYKCDAMITMRTTYISHSLGFPLTRDTPVTVCRTRKLLSLLTLRAPPLKAEGIEGGELITSLFVVKVRL